MAAPNPNILFSTLRTLSAVEAADSAPTSSSAFVNLGPRSSIGTIEIRYGSGATTGTPTSVTIGIWRKLTGPDGTVYIDRIATKTIANADIAAPSPTVVDGYGSEFYATVDAITGGSSPSVTLTVQARFVG